MAVTPFQRDICGLLADRRKATGEIDLFHDSIDAVARSWDRDRSQLVESGYGVKTLRERPGFVQASVSRGPDSLIVEDRGRLLGALPTVRVAGSADQ